MLGIMTKETQELSNPIGRELKIGFKGFTLRLKTKVCQNDLKPIWHHLALNFLGPNPSKYSIQFLKPNLPLGTKVHLNKIPSQVQ
jgi:hypothetical protein